MAALAMILCGAVAAIHLFFFALESYFWTRPLGARVFRRPAAFMKESAPLAFNQGLYNGFLAAGLVWGVALAGSGAGQAASVLTFFLSCVVVAGVVGALTVSRRIAFVQALPAVIALLVVRVWASS